MQWYKGIVMRGQQLGRTLGFPTLNLDPDVLPNTIAQGIYACRVKIHEKTYRGALYLGPRLVLDETQPVLEIHVLDFDQEIYDVHIEFSLGQYLRPIAYFPSLEEMKSQLKKDIDAIRTM